MDSPRRKLPKIVTLSYIFDYVIIVVLLIAFSAFDLAEPNHQHFSLQNISLQYPYAVHQTVSMSMCVVYAIVVPILAIAIYTLLIDGFYSHHKTTGRLGYIDGTYTFKNRLWELNCGLLGLFLSCGSAYVVTAALKNMCGKPRPDVIDRCQPRNGSTDLAVYGLSNYTICTQTDKSILKDGFRSFPSGHSSTAFAGLFYLSLYLAGKLHLLDNRGLAWKPFIVIAPSIGAALIATSRIIDARHHAFDVVSGSLLGVLTAYISYHQYFPPLTQPWKKGRAYPIRTWGSAMIAPVNSERIMPTDDGQEQFCRDRTAPPLSPTDIDVERGSVSSSFVGEGNAFRKQVLATQQRRRDNWSSLPSEEVGGAAGTYELRQQNQPDIVVDSGSHRSSPPPGSRAASFTSPQVAAIPKAMASGSD